MVAFRPACPAPKLADERVFRRRRTGGKPRAVRGDAYSVVIPERRARNWGMRWNVV